MVDLTGFKLTFDDEFNGLSVSQSGAGVTWSDIRETSRLNANADIGFGNSAFVDPGSGVNPFAVAGGALTISAVPAASAIVGPGTWASGLLQSSGSFSQLYGYFEIRAELPTDQGVWPAFWMLRADHSWPPEVDVMEAYGDTNLWQYVHSGPTNDQNQVWSGHASMASGYHTYGVDWEANYLTFYFDGQVTGRVVTPEDMHSPMYMLVDLAMKDGAGVTSATKSMEVDYIRAYASDPNAVAVALNPVSSPDGADTSDLHGAVTAVGSAANPLAKLSSLTLDGTTAGDTLQGGSGDDAIRGLDGPDTIDGGPGNDDVNGNAGQDSVMGGAGADTVRGGQGDDTVDGGDGGDIVNGNLGADIVRGGAGADTVYGGQGADTIYGDAGNDSLSGDLGDDLMVGGAGADSFGFGKGGGHDWIGDFNPAEGDHVVLLAGTAYTVSSYQNQVLITLTSGDSLGLAGVPASAFSSDWIVYA